MLYFRTWILFVRVIFMYLFSSQKNNKYYLAGKCLFSLSFRYPDKYKNSFVFFLKAYVKVLFAKKPKENNYYSIYGSGTNFIYHLTNKHFNEEEVLKEHVYYFDKTRLDGAVWKDSLLVC